MSTSAAVAAPTQAPELPAATFRELMKLRSAGPRRVELLGALFDRHGDTLRLPVPFAPAPLVLTRDAGAVRRILVDDAADWPKSFMYDELKPVLGEGLLTSNGEHWKRQRRLAQPAFHKPRLAALASTMAGSTAELLARWEGFAARGEPFDAAAELTRLTLTIAGRTLFGADLGADAGTFGRDLGLCLRRIDSRYNSTLRLPRDFPTPMNLRVRAAVRRMDQVVSRIIDGRRRAGAGGDDLLGMLLSARDADTGEGMSETELRDEVMTLLLAGHETTSNALAWSFSLLSAHPAERARLEAEVDSVLGGRAPGFEEWPRLRYTQMVLEESMRLYPPAWAIDRMAGKDTELSGFTVRKDTIVMIPIYALHHHPRHWPDPERFDPERFAPEQSQGRARAAFIPFAAGPRQCMGNHFAMLEATIALAMVAQRFRLEMLDAAPLPPHSALTLRPERGVKVRAVRR